jgi:hypothetical protein
MQLWMKNGPEWHYSRALFSAAGLMECITAIKSGNKEICRRERRERMSKTRKMSRNNDCDGIVLGLFNFSVALKIISSINKDYLSIQWNQFQFFLGNTQI